MERTISIIKPDAIFKNLIGVIISRFEVSGLMVIAMKMLRLNRNQIKEFYFEHREKFFFNDLVNFISSGPIIVQVLEGKNAIQKNRDIMGLANPEKALSGTLRSDYSDNCTKNIVHGSDSLESAKREIAYFFREDEIYDRVFLDYK